MQRSLWMLAMALALIAAWSIGRVQAQGDKVTFADPNHTIFTEMPNAGRAGVSSATLWGDPNAGAAGTYTKFVPGWDAGWHTHTADVQPSEHDDGGPVDKNIKQIEDQTKKNSEDPK